MILNTKRNAAPRLARLRTGTLSIAALLMGALAVWNGPRMVLAQDETERETREERVVAESADSHASASRESSHRLPDPESPPRFKASPGILNLPAPGPVPEIHAVPPAAPMQTPVSAAVATAPKVASGVIAAAPAQVYVAAEAPTAPRESRSDSVERRIERLERMVESLLKQGKKEEKRAEHDLRFNFKIPEFDADLKWKLEGMKPSEEQIARFQEQAAKIKEQAKLHAEKAVKEAERLVKDAELMARMHKPARETPGGHRDDALRHERQELEARRRALENEMRALERQIQRLEQQEQRLKRQEPQVEPPKRKSSADQEIF